MSDTLFLSLWYPNLRLAALPDKLVAVLSAFAAHGGERGVYSATVWPVGWSETPVFQRVWGRGTEGIAPRRAAEEALELLHDDYAYEFQIGWSLWELEQAAGLDPRWARTPRLVRVIGFGPLFDEGAYEQDGHIRIDFGNDAPFLEEEADSTRWARGTWKKMCGNLSSLCRPSKRNPEPRRACCGASLAKASRKDWRSG